MACLAPSPGEAPAKASTVVVFEFKLLKYSGSWCVHLKCCDGWTRKLARVACCVLKQAMAERSETLQIRRHASPFTSPRRGGWQRDLLADTSATLHGCRNELHVVEAETPEKPFGNRMAAAFARSHVNG